MTRRLPALVLLAVLAAPAAGQDDPVDSGWTKCDSEIAWLGDERKVRDNVQGRSLAKTTVDLDDLLEKAKDKSKETGRPILWYVPEVAGPHMYRPLVLDRYMKAAVWSDEAVVDLVQRRYVPLRAAAAGTLATDTGVKKWEIVEPAIVILDAEGKVLHSVQRIRTFNADFLLGVLRLAAAKFGKPFESDDAAELVRGGEYEKAMAKLSAGPSTPESRLALAGIARRLHLGPEALKALDEAEAGAGPETRSSIAAERGLVLFGLGRLAEARKSLEAAKAGPRASEARYVLAVAERCSGRDADAAKRFEELARDSARTRWGWRASANLHKHNDGVPVGPAATCFEDFTWTGDSAYGLARTTRWERTPADLPDVARRAVEWLLRNQSSSGGWTDSRYAFWPSPKILPNVHTSVTGLAAAALLDWREVDPARVDAALAAAEKFLLDDARLAPGENEEVYAHSYRLLYWLRKHAASKDAAVRKDCVARMGAVAAALGKIQDAQGYWAHEYPNPFCTAAALQALQAAAAAGAEIPEGMVARGLDALLATRGDRGRQAYGAPGRASAAKDSSARSAMCEAVLLAAGKTTKEEFQAAMDDFWTFLDRRENVRVCDFHSDGELGGFFFWHGFYHTSEAIALQDEPGRAASREKAAAHLARIPEIDGSFLDSHEMGKSYGTATALLSLKNALRR